MEENETDLRERAFHSAVREYIVCMLIFIALYALSYFVIRTIKKKSESDDLYAGDAEDYLVYRIAVWICTLSMAVSIGAVMLLPFSIFSNEILRLNPNSYYFQWLNSSLVQGLWNYIFLLSNACLFILLPFAYFFIESQGFTGLKKGIMTRVYESVAVCTLVMIVILCLTRIVSILLSDETARNRSLFNLWNYQLPFVYSCVSLFGVAMLLTCTPLGFARMFTVTGGLIVKPKLRKEIETELIVVGLEERNLTRKLTNGYSNGFRGSSHNIGAKESGVVTVLHKMAELGNLRAELERQKRSLRWLQNLKYPLVMLVLLALTVISVLMVTLNTVQLLTGFRSLPSYQQYLELGNQSLSTLGIYGSIIQVIIILYLMAASLVGFYSLPGLRRLKPVPIGQSSMTKVICNCVAVLVLSSALPVLARTLGITNFDLLGDFGKIDWLGNFYLVCSYNVLFALATALCLAKKFTSTVRRELCDRFNEAGMRIRRRHFRSVSISCDGSGGETSHMKIA